MNRPDFMLTAAVRFAGPVALKTLTTDRSRTTERDRKMRKTFPNLPNWSFDLDGVSANVYEAIGTDIYGHRVSYTGTDLEKPWTNASVLQRQLVIPCKAIAVRREFIYLVAQLRLYLEFGS